MPRVAHVITRLILGGAQENTLHTVIGHRARGRYAADLLSGPTFGREGTLVPAARAGGVEPIHVPHLRRAIGPLDALALWHLGRLLDAGRYDLVHTHSSKAGILGREAAARAGVPVVVHTAHGWPFDDEQPVWMRELYVRLERRAAAKTDAIVVVTPRLAEDARARGIQPRRGFEVIRNGIELDRYRHPARDRARVRDALGLPPGAFVVGSVSRLSSPKSPEVLVGAAALVARERDDVFVVVVGDGPLRGRLERQIRREGLDGRVLLLGTREDVPDLLGAIDLFVLSTNREGLPRVVPQAMAAGVPVVASEVDGNAEIVVDGRNGRLVPPRDTGALARAIQELAADPAARRRLVEAGRESANAFDVDRMVVATEALYDRLLGGQGPA